MAAVIARYSRPAMARIWSDEARLERMLEVELAALEGGRARRRCPGGGGANPHRRARAVPRARRRARARDEPRCRCVRRRGRETLGDDGRWFHFGLTSSDVLDTALSLAVQEAGAAFSRGSSARSTRSSTRAEEHRDTLCMGRTHGVHAEPTTFGLKLAGWAFELDRDRQRLERAVEGLRVGKLSGAVGQYAAIDPEVERIACERLGLEPAPSSTQILQRDRHAELLSALALARLVTRSVCDGDPASRANRGARGRGAVRTRPEGLLCDAAQAQPGHRRADLRPGPFVRANASSGSRTSRSGTSATSRTARPSASCSRTRSWLSTTSSTASRGSSKGSSFGRSG